MRQLLIYAVMYSADSKAEYLKISVLGRVNHIPVEDIQILVHVQAVGAAIAVDLMAAMIHGKAQKRHDISLILRNGRCCIGIFSK